MDRNGSTTLNTGAQSDEQESGGRSRRNPMEDSDLEDYDRLHIQPMDYLLGYYISIADKYE
jgi:hypothetical protein